ncbi:Gfo/Idh/MocA family oxidoreductase [candidate division KSB1 bacterium]|nr:Gfo/Idh/MocA family oxidoreductase [candidate division KSB1 bacterium]
MQDQAKTSSRDPEKKPESGSNIGRRKFLGRLSKGAGIALLAPAIVPRNVLGRGFLPPSDQITMGFVGCGGMGEGLLSGFLPKPEVRVLAVCDVDADHRVHFQKRVGKGCDAYLDFRELTDRTDIDAAVIATPDHWHTLTSLAAVESGKDVYCEKPLTLYIKEGRKLAQAVRRNRAVFQVGSMQRSDENFRRACELVRSGRIGEIHTVTTGIGGGPVIAFEPTAQPPERLDWNFWLGPAPVAPYSKKRCHFNFRWFWDYSGGKVTDWGAHHNDIAQWGLGMDESGPVKIKGKGEYPQNAMSDTFVSFEIVYTYATGTKLICTSQGENGVTFYGTKGEIFVSRGSFKATPEEIAYEPPDKDYVHLYRSMHHYQNFLDCIKTRQKPICDVEIGHRSATVCHLGNIAMRIGRELEWDPQKEEFVNDPNANRWIDKPLRKPWTL